MTVVSDTNASQSTVLVGNDSTRLRAKTDDIQPSIRGRFTDKLSLHRVVEKIESVEKSGMAVLSDQITSLKHAIGDVMAYFGFTSAMASARQEDEDRDKRAKEREVAAVEDAIADNRARSARIDAENAFSRKSAEATSNSQNG